MAEAPGQAGFGAEAVIPIETPAQFTDHIGGFFFPQGAGAPTVSKMPSGYISKVTRSGVGLYPVQVLVTAGFVKPILAATQNPTPINIQLTPCIDPAGAVQPIQAQVIGSPTLKANTFSFTVGVFRTDTNVAYDIIQPGSPTLNGSFILWRIVWSELRSTRVPFKGGF
jgi:hypothetical protein